MNTSTIIKRILKLLKPYGLWLTGSILLSVLTVIGAISIPVLTGQAVDLLIGVGQVNFTELTPVLVKLLLIVAATALGQWLLALTNNHMVYHIVANLRQQTFTHLQKVPLSYLDGQRQGDIQARIVTDIDQFSEGLLMGFSNLFTGVLTVVITLVFMFRLNFWVTILVVAVTPLSIVVAGFIAKKSYIYFRQQAADRGAMTALASEMIDGQDTVKDFSMQQKIVDDFCAADEKLHQSSFKAVFYSSITNPSTRFVNSLIYAGVGIGGALAALSHTLSVGQLTAFLSYATQYTKPFNEISGVVAELQNSIACAQRIFVLLDVPTEPADHPQAQPLTEINGQVSISQVYFAYDKAKPLLQAINIKADHGQRIAIVGPTGCGKTTLINLLMRFYDVDRGVISIDGHDILALPRQNVRSAFGMVLQDTWLANATVADNIAFGCPQASRQQIEQAAKQCHVDEFIQRLPQGYDTVLNSADSGLSAGQQQLLCIARVILAKPKMLILDEATSAIDTRTELLVGQAFDALMKGRTSFVVAHRLSTIRNADLIIVMQNGRIVQSGKHDQLLKDGGAYAQLYNSQFEQVG